MPEVPWDAGQAYLDFYRPVVHVMRRLKEQGKLDENTSIFFNDRKPDEELYDWKNDPHEMRNLMHDPEYVEVVAKMRDRLGRYQADHVDRGLEDLGRRKVDLSGAPEVRMWLQREHPDRWRAVTRDIFVKYETLAKEYRSRKT